MKKHFLTPKLIMVALAALLVLGGGAWAALQFMGGANTPSRLTILVSGKTIGVLENCG